MATRLLPSAGKTRFPREEREAQDVDPGGAESENRNYNFFDELDARFAGLRNAASAGDC